MTPATGTLGIVRSLMAIAVLAAAPAAGTPLTPAQLEAMTPAAIGDALLPPGHPPIVQKLNGGEGGPPPPPGAPIETEVRLYAAARPAAEPGFCEKTAYRLFLAPVRPGQDGTLPAAPVGRIEQTATYRLRPKAAGAPCEADHVDFFPLVAAADAPRVFGAIRLLADARRRAAAGGPLDFTGRVDDALARETLALVAHDPAYAAWKKANQPDTLVAVTDWRAALARFPTDRIGFYAPRAEILAASPTIGFSAGDNWTADLTVRDGKLVDVALRRAIPPPF